MARDDDDLLLGPAGYVFQTPVQAKKHKPQAKGKHGRMRLAGTQIGRVVRRRPEVMVKVTGSARGFRSLREHLAYITRNGKIGAEREGGERIEGAGHVRELAAEWWADCGRGRKASARDTINLILSMPPGTDPMAVAAATSAFAQKIFGGTYDDLLARQCAERHKTRSRASVTSAKGEGERHRMPALEYVPRWSHPESTFAV